MRPRDPVACDYCDSPLQPDDGRVPGNYHWSEREVSSASFATCVCSSCSGKHYDAVPTYVEHEAAILRRAARHSPEWAAAVRNFLETQP